MDQLAPLGIYIILAVILPGLIITSTVMVFFPGLRSLVPQGTIEIIGIVIAVAFINEHLALPFERYVLDPLWGKIFPSWHLRERRDLFLKRSQIIANAETEELAHTHYDQTLGEFVMIHNTSFGLFLAALIRLIIGPYTGLPMIICQ